jgi:hypothetical protein
MNHKVTKEYMLDGLQDRIDRLSNEIWTRKNNIEMLEKNSNKKFNKRKYENKI